MFKRRLFAWTTGLALAAVMLFSASAAVFAESATAEDGVTAQIEVSVQSEMTFSFMHKELTVSSTLSDTYGYADQVPATKVSALDALIAAHIDAYGADSEKVKANLEMQAGNPSKMMGYKKENGYTGFAVNEAYAFQEGNSTMGAMVNQAVVKNGDRVDFFWYEDPAWEDYVTFFEQNGEKVFSIKEAVNRPFTLQLTGFKFMDGYTNPTNQPISGANLMLLNGEGSAYDVALDEKGNPAETDQDGKVIMSLPAGTYYLTAEKGKGQARLVMPLVKVVVANNLADASLKLAYKSTTYSGKAKKPSVAVTFEGNTLKEGKDYSLIYERNVRVGDAKVILSGMGDFEGSKTVFFTILPGKTEINKVSKGKKSFKVRWKKQPKETNGYEIQYATSKKFKGAKSILIKKNAETSKTVKKLKSKKTYYVKVRTYSIISGKKYYSAWSKTKSVKVR